MRKLYSVFCIIQLQTTNVGNDTQHMTSIEMAELTAKQHKDVLKAIRNMEPAWVKTTGRNFALCTYKDSTGRTLPCFNANMEYG
jgi:phage regulator Rha-like protein